jgi:segregation and condensation protein B
MRRPWRDGSGSRGAVPRPARRDRREHPHDHRDPRLAHERPGDRGADRLGRRDPHGLGLAAAPAGGALSELTYTVEELAAAAEAPPERIERALDALGERHSEGRSGVVLERVSGGYALRAAAGCATACARLLDRDVDRPLSQAALETLAIVAYAGPVTRPEIARIRGVAADAAVASLQERGLIEEAGRARTPGGAVLYRTTTLFDRIFALADGRSSLPPIEELAEAAASPDALRDRLVAVAAQRS